MFSIGIKYLCGVARATHPAQRDKAEWPPHPDRVFMALVAAHFETDGPSGEREALEWLEAQEAPEIAAAECFTREMVTTYVPVNDSSAPRIKPKKGFSDAQLKDGLALFPEARLRQPRHFPTVVLENPVVHLCWPHSQPSSEVRSAIERLCEKVTYLGHSASLVQAWVEDQPPEANLVPNVKRGQMQLRVISPGRLKHLQGLFNAEAVESYNGLRSELEVATGKREKELRKQIKEEFNDLPPQSLRPTAGTWRTYGEKHSAEIQPTVKQTVFDHQLIVLRRLKGRRLGLESTLQITRALRSTIMSKCPTDPPPSWISGHKPDGSPANTPHLACIPLPNVGYEHSDGHLLGLGIVLPRGLSSEELRLLEPIIGYDSNGISYVTRVVLGSLGEWEVQLEDRTSHPVSLQETIWTGSPQSGSRRFGTVTPIVFDRHPKKKSPEGQWEEIERMIGDACERIGLARPLDIIPSAVSHFVGVPHARRFPLLQRKSGGNLHHTHAILTFEEPVVGPLLLGAGRYRGYGFCRPLNGVSH